MGGSKALAGMLGRVWMETNVYSSECIASGKDSRKSVSMMCVNLSMPSFIFSQPGSSRMTSLLLFIPQFRRGVGGGKLNPLRGVDSL
jgi:hypothetical protein